MVSRLFRALRRRKPEPPQHDPDAHHHHTWTARQFRDLLAAHDLSDIDAAGRVGQPSDAVRRLRSHLHLHHRDGLKAGLPDVMLRVLEAEHEPWTCAVCRTSF